MFYVCNSSNFKIFCEKLLLEVGGLHLWAATFFTKSIHNKWDKTRLTTPLRSPQVVIKEVVKQTLQTLIPYSQPLGIDKTDGPQIREINHRSHSERTIQNCIQCGQEIGSVLHDLHGVDSGMLILFGLSFSLSNPFNKPSISMCFCLFTSLVI